MQITACWNKTMLSTEYSFHICKKTWHAFCDAHSAAGGERTTFNMRKDVRRFTATFIYTARTCRQSMWRVVELVFLTPWEPLRALVLATQIPGSRSLCCPAAVVLSMSTALLASRTLTGGTWNMSKAMWLKPSMKARGWWVSWSSCILVTLASIRRCVYMFMSRFLRVRSSRLSYLFNKINTNYCNTKVILGTLLWQILHLEKKKENTITSSFCFALRSGRLPFQQNRGRYEQRHLRGQRHRHNVRRMDSMIDVGIQLLLRK